MPRFGHAGATAAPGTPRPAAFPVTRALTDKLPSAPAWWVLLLLPLLHFASVKLTFSLAMSPENEVVVWLPNAVLLAALLHWRGQRGAAMVALTFASDVYANLPVFPAQQAVLLSLCNLGEVMLAWLLMRRLAVSPELERIQDFGRFLLAGPLIGALSASLLAGLVLCTLEGVRPPYATMVLLWWFGDALGLLIYTPLLLSLLHPAGRRSIDRTRGAVMMVVTLAAAAFIFTQGEGSDHQPHVLMTPQLLLIPLLYIAARCSVRCTALAIALISLGSAWSVTTGHHPFGDASAHETILRAQEYILTLSTIGMGLAILLGEQRALAHELEDKVRERTHALEASNRLLAELSTTDSLTGIANRRRFDEALSREWARAQRSGESLSLCLLDVDYFKAYNDHYGHQAGDECLRLVAQVIGGHARRAGDLVARYGGEEFAFISSGIGANHAMEIAEAVRAALQAQARPHLHSPLGVLTASVGVAVQIPGVDDTPDSLFRLADQALYEAKRRGRNRVEAASGHPLAAPEAAFQA